MSVGESFLSLHHLVDNYAKIVDERGRNMMCVRTLPSLLSVFRALSTYTRDTLPESVKNDLALFDEVWTRMQIRNQ